MSSSSSASDLTKWLARSLSVLHKQADDPEALAVAVEWWIRQFRGEASANVPAAFTLGILGKVIWGRAVKQYGEPRAVDDKFYSVVLHAVGSIKNPAPDEVIEWLLQASDRLAEASSDPRGESSGLLLLGNAFRDGGPCRPDTQMMARARERSSPLDGRTRRRSLSESNEGSFIGIRIDPAQIKLDQ